MANNSNTAEKLDLFLVDENGNEIKESKFRVFYRKSSGNLRSEVRDIMVDSEKTRVRLSAKLEMPDEDGQTAAIAFLREKPDVVCKNKDIQIKDFGTLADERTRLIAQAIINTDGLNEDQIDAVTSAVDSPFWLSLDMVDLERWVGGFLSRNGL